MSLGFIGALCLGAGALGVGLTALTYNKLYNTKFDSLDRKIEELKIEEENKLTQKKLNELDLSYNMFRSCYQTFSIAEYVSTSGAVWTQTAYVTGTAFNGKNNKSVIITANHITQESIVNVGNERYTKTNEEIFIKSELDKIKLVKIFEDKTKDFALFESENLLNTLDPVYKFGDSKSLFPLGKVFLFGYNNNIGAPDIGFITMHSFAPGSIIANKGDYIIDPRNIFMLKTDLGKGASGALAFSDKDTPSIVGMFIGLSSDSVLHRFAIKSNSFKEEIKPYISEEYYQ